MQPCLVQFARTCPSRSKRSFEPVAAFPLFAEEMKRIHDARSSVPWDRERSDEMHGVNSPSHSSPSFSFYSCLLFSSSPPSPPPVFPCSRHPLIAPSLLFASRPFFLPFKNRWWMYKCVYMCARMYTFNGPTAINLRGAFRRRPKNPIGTSSPSVIRCRRRGSVPSPVVEFLDTAD